MQTLYNPK